MQFTPLKDFFSDELRSQYCVGLSYTARNQDSKLKELLPSWIDEGKVRLGAPDSINKAKIAGIGKAG